MFAAQCTGTHWLLEDLESVQTYITRRVGHLQRSSAADEQWQVMSDAPTVVSATPP